MNKVVKKSAFSAILKQECPQCRSHPLFLHPTYSTSFLKMHKTCPKCNANLDPEPGFYWGAMYISYGFNTALAVILSVIMWFSFDPEMWVYIVVIIGINLLLSPIFFRYSRILMLYGMGGLKFKPEYLN